MTTHPRTRREARSVPRGFAAIGLFNPKNAINVGHVLRAAGCFEAKLVVIQGVRYSHAPPDTMADYRHIPLLSVEDLLTAIPFDCVPIAIEIAERAKPLETYPHPPRGYYIFGPEDGTLPPRVLDRCRDVLSIPAGCLNLAAAVNVVLYDRTAKLVRAARTEMKPIEVTTTESPRFQLGGSTPYQPARIVSPATAGAPGGR